MTFYRPTTESTLMECLVGQGHSRTKVKQLVGYQAVYVNGVAATRSDQIVGPGDRVSIKKDTADARVVPAQGLKLVYEDDALVVAEKPTGLLTIATEREKTRTAYYQLNEFLAQRASGSRQRVFIVHRLDRETSGLIVFAKSEAAKRTLQHHWNEVEKRYYALVERVPRQEEGAITSRLRETKSLRVFSSPDKESGKPATTKYRLITCSRDYALLDVVLKTGRKNQIRVHLADIGHPVVGDKKYGARTDPCRRLGLHAYLLAFSHPVTGKTMRFESPLPEQLRMAGMGYRDKCTLPETKQRNRSRKLTATVNR